MNHLADYMTVTRSRFRKLRPRVRWRVFETLREQDAHFAGDLVRRLRAARRRGAELAVVLPTGPIDYRPFVRLVNRERVSLGNLHVFMMDEYCRDDRTWIEQDHPLAFRPFIRGLLQEGVRRELRMPADQLRFPDPADPGAFTRSIAELGGIDVAYGGLGVNGHLAFNDPPDDPRECTVEAVRDSVTRVVRLSRETITQNAIAGTRGLIELVPPLAVTIGMRELLSAREVHLYLLRKWHAGIFRRCLFGPVTPTVPGSFLQEHPALTVHLPEYVVAPPVVVVTLDV
jgi:glucosamine-6-phosphate deaminase